MFVHTLVSARGRIGGESITTQSNQFMSCSIIGRRSTRLEQFQRIPRSGSRREDPDSWPVEPIHALDQRSLALEPLANAGPVRNAKYLRLRRPADIPFQQQHLLLGAKRQGACHVRRHHALAFLRNRAGNKNLLQRPLPAQMPQTNTKKMKSLAGRALVIRKRHQMALRAY